MTLTVHGYRSQVGTRYPGLWSRNIPILNIPPGFTDVFTERSLGTRMGISVDFSEGDGEYGPVQMRALDAWLCTPVIHRMNLESMYIHLTDKDTLFRVSNLGPLPSLRNLSVFVDPNIYSDANDLSYQLGTLRMQHATAQRLILENCLLVDMLSEEMTNLTKLSLSFSEDVVHWSAETPELPPLPMFLRFLGYMHNLVELRLDEVFPDVESLCGVRITLPPRFTRIELVAAKCIGSVAAELTRRCLATLESLHIPSTADQFLILAADNSGSEVVFARGASRLFAVESDDQILSTDLVLSDTVVEAIFSLQPVQHTRATKSIRRFESHANGHVDTPVDLPSTVINRKLVSLQYVRTLAALISTGSIFRRLFSPSIFSHTDSLALKSAVNVRTLEFAYADATDIAPRLALQTHVDSLCFSFFPRMEIMHLSGSDIDIEREKINDINVAILNVVRVRHAVSNQTRLRILRVSRRINSQQALDLWNRLRRWVKVEFV